MSKLRAFVVMTFVLAALHARNSSADIVIYNNFGLGDSYSTASGWTLSGPGNGFELEAAMPFVPGGTYTFLGADLAVSLLSGTNHLTVALAADNSGAPGAAMETFQFDSALGPFGSNNAPLQALSLTNPTLASGATYWLVASVAGDTLAAWNDNSAGALGGSQQFDAGGWASYPDLSTAAFRITGAEIRAVPEPATIALFGVGTLAAIGFHFARRRRSARLPG